MGKISPALWQPCFFEESSKLEQPWYRVTKETFLPNYIEISLVVSDKIFSLLPSEKHVKTHIYTSLHVLPDNVEYCHLHLLLLHVST